VLVIGAGVRGRIAALLAEALGAAAVVVDGDPARRAEALRIGVAAAWEAGDDPQALIERLAAHGRERGLGMFSLKIVESTSTAVGRRRALAVATAAGAGAVLLGDGDGLPALAPLGAMADAEVQLVGAGPCHPDLLPELAALVVRGALKLGELCEVRAFREYAHALGERRQGTMLRLAILGPAGAGEAAP
jgi:threonine dehydrogenase-like Zn-dependent dehydrogenase